MLLHTRQTKGTIGVVAVYVYIHSISYDICMSNMITRSNLSNIEGQTLQWPKDKRNMKTKTMVDKILQIE
jgi:hypothetical protein